MKNISPQEALDILSKDKTSILIDVRTQEEWSGGVTDIENLKFATISANLDEFENNIQNIAHEFESPALFICRGGVRSAKAAEIAEKLGYKNCYNIIGGFTEWCNANLPYRMWSAK
jgi:rhodanese-related sulfurtransferase